MVSPYAPSFDRPGPSFERSKEIWWMPRVVALFLRYARDEPICIRWLNAPIRFFPPRLIPPTLGADPPNSQAGSSPRCIMR